MKRITTIIISALFLIAPTASAIEFLGVELCKGSTDTTVDVPVGSSLVLESAEIGDNGGLVLLLSARSGNVMNHVDDLMTGLTGRRGDGDGDNSLEWTGGHLTGVAQRVAKKYAALAVASTDECTGRKPASAPAPEAAPAEAPRSSDVESVMTTPDPVPAAAAAVVAASHASPPESEPEPVAAAAIAAVADSNPSPPSDPVPTTNVETDFELVGAMTHSAADEIWVDVMGSIVNHTDTRYKTATFDLSLYGNEGELICVDTILVSIFKPGQERAFRDSIRCPGYEAAEIAEVRLHFAGGF
jgi:hypothetical protein